MAIDAPVLLAFNRGLISKRALARVDVGRTALSAEEQTNWMPRVLGSMMLRPGLGYISSTYQNNKAYYVPFFYSVDDTALIEITDGAIRVFDGTTEEVITRTTAAFTITNGEFTSNLTGWTDADDSGATSAWVTGGYMGLAGTDFAYARRRQQVTAAAGTHSLRITVERGPVFIKIGSAAGLQDFRSETQLRTGSHSLEFTTTGSSFWIELAASRQYQALVTSVATEVAGAMVLTAPWPEASLPELRYSQSKDVIFFACRGYRQKRLERTATNSYSLVDYESEDGPFKVENTSPVVLTPSAQVGDITLTASEPFFTTEDVGALFKLTSTGQKVIATFTGEDQYSGYIKVQGTGNERRWLRTLTGLTGNSTAVTLQRSVSEPGAWTDVASYTDNLTESAYNDNLSNQIIYYRFGIKTGDYDSGTIGVVLDYASSGSITGKVKIVGFTSSTSVSAIVFDALGGTDGTSTWAEAEWSPRSGWPTAVGFFEGRLWFFGNDRIWGSASDAFDSFDSAIEGDSAPITRSIGDGPTEIVTWMLPLQQLLIGCQSQIFSAKASSLEEPLTNTAFGLKRNSSQGCASVDAIAVDTDGYYVQRNGTRIYELSVRDRSFNYSDVDITSIVPEIGEPGVVRMAVQRQPDTRIHCVRSDGKVAVLVVDRAEEVKCWVLVEAAANGIIEDVVVLPGSSEDRVFYVVKRVVNEQTVRYLEKWATEEEARGEAATKLMDSFIVYSGDAISSLSVPHLEGEQVVVWSNSTSVDDTDGTAKRFTVAGGLITLSSPTTYAVIGLPYQAKFKSSKLAYASSIGTALTMRKRVARVGLIAADMHARGLRYGPSYSVLDDLPGVEDGAIVDPDHIWEEYDKDDFPFPGEWSPDSRICLVADSPRPVTVMAIPFTIEGHKSP